jgi:hypothetical protein
MARKKYEYEPLTSEDVDGHYWVVAEIISRTAQDEMMASQIAQVMRQPNSAGYPTMSDYDILSEVLKKPHPEEILKRAQMQVFTQGNPDAQKLIGAALFKEWKETNKELVREGEKELNPPPEEQDKEFQKFLKGLTPEKFKELVRAMAQLEHAKNMGADPNQMIGMMQAAQASAASMNESQSMLPATVQAPTPNPPPNVMPSQMEMMDAGAQTGNNPDAMVVDQMRRGKSKNMHKG